MANGDSNGHGNGKLTIDMNRSFWFSALQTFGFPVVGCLVLGWFANSAINWEREQMLPAIQKSQSTLDAAGKVIEGNTKAITGNTEALHDNTESTKSFKSSLDMLKQHMESTGVNK